MTFNFSQATNLSQYSKQPEISSQPIQNQNAPSVNLIDNEDSNDLLSDQVFPSQNVPSNPSKNVQTSIFKNLNKKSNINEVIAPKQPTNLFNKFKKNENNQFQDGSKSQLQGDSQRKEHNLLEQQHFEPQTTLQNTEEQNDILNILDTDGDIAAQSSKFSLLNLYSNDSAQATFPKPQVTQMQQNSGNRQTGPQHQLQQHPISKGYQGFYPPPISVGGGQPHIIGGANHPQMSVGGNQPHIIGGGGNHPQMSVGGNQPHIIGGVNQPHIIGGGNQPHIIGGVNQPHIIGGGNQPHIIGGKNQAPISVGNQAHMSVGYQAPMNVGYQAPMNVGYQAPMSAGYQAPMSAGYQAPMSVGYQPHIIGGNQSHMGVGNQPSHISGGYQTQMNGIYACPPGYNQGYPYQNGGIQQQQHPPQQQQQYSTILMDFSKTKGENVPSIENSLYDHRNFNIVDDLSQKNKTVKNNIHDSAFDFISM